jgi:hypothetical protein
MVDSESIKRGKNRYTFLTKADDADSLSTVNNIVGLSGKWVHEPLVSFGLMGRHNSIE